MGMALKSGRCLKRECDNCGAIYNIVEESYPTRERGSIKCNYCGAKIHEWNGGRICEAKVVSAPVKENYRKFDDTP
ncbi:MAG: hypothetical protein LBH98_04965 [Chitinispirillales bacterium]|nr:hypothetical protein [Chitinispirillales bacterium]